MPSSLVVGRAVAANSWAARRVEGRHCGRLPLRLSGWPVAEGWAAPWLPKCVICSQPPKRYGEFANGGALLLADAYVRIRSAMLLACIIGTDCWATAMLHSLLCRFRVELERAVSFTTDSGILTFDRMLLIPAGRAFTVRPCITPWSAGAGVWFIVVAGGCAGVGRQAHLSDQGITRG